MRAVATNIGFSFHRFVSDLRFHANWESMVSFYHTITRKKKRTVRQSFGDRAIKEIIERQEKKNEVCREHTSPN
jgi:hypothetical protein